MRHRPTPEEIEKAQCDAITTSNVARIKELELVKAERDEHQRLLVAAHMNNEMRQAERQDTLGKQLNEPHRITRFFKQGVQS